ncbi:MAG: glycosyltransferase family 52 [Pseudomonadota bacterium]
MHVQLMSWFLNFRSKLKKCIISRLGYLSDQKERSLVVCTSPFQAIIVQRIFHEGYLSDFDLLFVTEFDSAKHRHYFAQTALLAEKSLYLYIKKRKNSLQFLNLFFNTLNFTRYNRVFISIIVPWYMRFILELHRDAVMVSFDDGWGNILERGRRLLELESEYDQLHAKYFDIPIERYLMRSVKHFTFEDRYPCMFPNAELVSISIFRYPPDVARSRGEGIAVVAGHPTNGSRILATAERFTQSVSYIYYVPHPREEVHESLTPEIEVIRTDKIIEEVIIDLLKESKDIMLIAGRSTSLLTLGEINIRKIYIIDDEDDGFIELALHAGCEIVRSD